MEFKIKTDEEIKTLIKEEKLDELAQYYNELNANNQKELESKIEAKADAKDIEEFMKKFDEMKDVQMKNMNELLELQGLEIKKLKASEGERILSKDEFREALTKVAKDLKNRNEKPQYIRGKAKDGELGNLFTKAVGTMSFTDSVTGTIPQADRDPGFNDFDKQRFTVRGLSDTGTTSANLKEWVYKAAKEGGAGMTAEGAAKTQLDWTYVVDSAAVKKITSFIKITKEMLDDIEGIMSDINGELSYEINLLEEQQLLAGTGLTVYLNGIEKYAGDLDHASLSGTIATPNYWDVLAAADTQIQIESLQSSRANGILMHPADVFKMVYGSRTTTNEYNYPVTVTPNGTMVNGLPVIESTDVTAGEYYVCDFSKFHIRDREGLSIAMGYDSDDWTKNLVTILGEKRLVSYVKKNDENAFVWDTFADGITFLTAST
jgi:HK97 family phage major capsid protein